MIWLPTRLSLTRSSAVATPSGSWARASTCTDCRSRTEPWMGCRIVTLGPSGLTGAAPASLRLTMTMAVTPTTRSGAATSAMTRGAFLIAAAPSRSRSRLWFPR